MRQIIILAVETSEPIAVDDMAIGIQADRYGVVMAGEAMTEPFTARTVAGAAKDCLARLDGIGGTDVFCFPRSCDVDQAIARTIRDARAKERSRETLEWLATMRGERSAPTGASDEALAA